MKLHGGALVVGTIDETGMAVTAERPDCGTLSPFINEEIWHLASDIIFDPLVFPVGTGDAQYIVFAEKKRSKASK
ncbi:hypothetical protein ACEQPO_08935 [Bacillus sp. SL00103]